MSALIKNSGRCPHPVGAISELLISDNPATMWSNTAWIQCGGGRVTVAINGAIPAFAALENTGGSIGHVMTINNLIQHNHAIDGQWVGGNGSNIGAFDAGATTTLSGNTTVNTGQASPEAIPTMPPYLVVARWERTA